MSPVMTAKLKPAAARFSGVLAGGQLTRYLASCPPAAKSDCQCPEHDEVGAPKAHEVRPALFAPRRRPDVLVERHVDRGEQGEHGKHGEERAEPPTEAGRKEENGSEWKREDPMLRDGGR